MSISSLLNFSAYADDYALEYSISGMSSVDGLDQLDATVASGKRVKGYVTYEADKDYKEIEVHFKPNAWLSEEFVFRYTKE